MTDQIQTHATNRELGMSEIGAILGLSQFASAADVAIKKLSHQPDIKAQPTGDTSPMYWGLANERAIADAFGVVMDVKVRADGHTYRKDNLRTVCHLDYRIEGQPAIVECKHPGSIFSGDWGEPGTASVPEYILAQCHGQMWHVDKAERVYVPRLIGHRFDVYCIERDENWFPVLEKAVTDFWALVDVGDIPPLDYSRSNVNDTLKLMYPDFHPGDVVQLGDREQALQHELDDVSAQRLELEKAEAALKARLKHRVERHQFGLLPDGRAYKRSVTKRKGFTVAASEIDTFRLLKELPAVLR